MTTNPLLADTDLPDFAAVRPEHLVPAVETLIADARAAADRIGGSNASDFDGVVLASERAGFAIARGWSPASHLHSVADTPELRTAYAEAQAMLAEYGMEAGQDPRMFAAFNRVDLAPLSEAEARSVELTRRDFRLSGVALEEDAKARFRAIGVELNRLATEFGNAVLDSTEAWSEHITDEAMLAGLTDNAKAILATYAAEKALDGWLVTLREPSVQAILTQADDRDLRARVARAFATRASDQAADPSHDNSARIDEILALRHEAAQLLGFSDAAARSVETKMAQSADEALTFLSDLAARARPLAEAEIAEATAYATETFGITKLQPWDMGYVAEHMRRERFGVDREAIRAYFPLPRVMDGTVALIERLYGIRLVERADVSVWNDDVRYYDVQDKDGTVVAGVYCDFYARAGKRGGAWMDVCRPRFRDADRFHRPIAYLVCNFPPVTGDKPALLAHSDVVTLLHEFGHVLHHLLTEVDLPSIGGISGVEWDAVELPSQFMENFAWDRDTLTSLSAHVDTGESLPEALFAKMLAARRFQAGLFLLRQIEFATFDLTLHRDYDPARGGRVMDILNAVRAQVAVIHPPEWNRFPHSFSHIFAGGYAAGYYSYLWAELLSADAFAAFAEEGQAAGDRFRREVLARGASRPAAENFKAFRGRAPQPDALLRHHGLAA
ncbi:M3 family metallopeptidase [Sphingomonas pseudosanguinis]|uniref:M3 family metallopeptidase n=1 Tax=Sphingomonas pseudosanguinis TaxID=413712 RepID=UPI003F84D2A5